VVVCSVSLPLLIILFFAGRLIFSKSFILPALRSEPLLLVFFPRFPGTCSFVSLCVSFFQVNVPIPLPYPRLLEKIPRFAQSFASLGAVLCPSVSLSVYSCRVDFSSAGFSRGRGPFFPMILPVQILFEIAFIFVKSCFSLSRPSLISGVAPCLSLSYRTRFTLKTSNVRFLRLLFFSSSLSKIDWFRISRVCWDISPLCIGTGPCFDYER